jgi:protease PrsW
MFCNSCGSACLPENKFCKNCGAPVGAAASAQEAPPAAPAPTVQPVQPAQAVPPAAYPAAYPAGYPAAYPGAPPGVYPAAYPGAQQPVYYVTPQAAAHAHRAQMNLMQNLRGRIQSMASTESLEGFSLKDMFSQVFKRHGADAVEDYILVGTTKTTPPIELVETGWPKPWLFFRLLAVMVGAYMVLTFMFMQTGNANCVPGMMFLGAFAVPLATLTLFFELDTPRNVSIHVVGKLFLMGAVVSLGVALLGYALPIFDISEMEAGVVEEVAKLLTVVILMRAVRYKYILNGILFGATVGAGFAAFETAGYALNEALLPGLIQGLIQGGSTSAQVMTAATHQGVVAMLGILRLRGIEAPLGHVAWTALSAGAFWRVKQDKPFSPAMLFDKRFLKAFAIPVLMHATWDAPWQLPFSGNQILTGLITWYVVFMLVQQGLRQVQEEQKVQLQATLASVEAQMLPPGTAVV